MLKAVSMPSWIPPTASTTRVNAQAIDSKRCYKTKYKKNSVEPHVKRMARLLTAIWTNLGTLAGVFWILLTEYLSIASSASNKGQKTKRYSNQILQWQKPPISKRVLGTMNWRLRAAQTSGVYLIFQISNNLLAITK